MIEFNIPAISCNHCVGAVTRAAQAVDPAARVRVDLALRRVEIESTLPAEVFRAALVEEGYAPA